MGLSGRRILRNSVAVVLSGTMWQYAALSGTVFWVRNAKFQGQVRESNPRVRSGVRDGPPPRVRIPPGQRLCYFSKQLKQR